MSSYNCCFLACIQISQEAGQVVCYSHFFQKRTPNAPHLYKPLFKTFKHLKCFISVFSSKKPLLESSDLLQNKLAVLQVCWQLSSWDPLSPWSLVQSHSHVRLFATPWTAAFQAFLSIILPSLLKLTSIKSVIPSNRLILCLPLLLLPSIFPTFRVFFQSVSSSHQVAKVLEFQLQHQSFQCIFRTDFL